MNALQDGSIAESTATCDDNMFTITSSCACVFITENGNQVSLNLTLQSTDYYISSTLQEEAEDMCTDNGFEVLDDAEHLRIVINEVSGLTVSSRSVSTKFPSSITPVMSTVMARVGTLQ